MTQHFALLSAGSCNSLSLASGALPAAASTCARSLVPPSPGGTNCLLLRRRARSRNTRLGLGEASR